MEGTGRVVEANGQNIQHWVAKRVSFLMPENVGIWGDFSIAKPDTTFQIDEDVDLTTAASGIVNPLTVIGIITNYNKVPGKKGIIHTAAASSLGRMLNRYCQSHGIPLLNIVRKDQQAELLKSEGAQHVLVTKGDQENFYKRNCEGSWVQRLFRCSGRWLSTLKTNHWPSCQLLGFYIWISGAKAFDNKEEPDFSQRCFPNRIHFTELVGTLSQEQKSNIKTGCSQLLKGDLKTKLQKFLTFAQIEEALKLSVQKTLEGKITLAPK